MGQATLPKPGLQNQWPAGGHHLKSYHLLTQKTGLRRIVCKLHRASATDMKMLEAGNLFPGRGLRCHLAGE